MQVVAKLAVSIGFIARLALAQDHGEEASREMGPVAFMWPPDRLWGADQDNHAPCGSAASVTNRTIFPLLNGVISLVAQDESWQIQVAISHSNNPLSNDDFETVIAPMRIPELNEGHQCYPIPNPAADVEAGANATLQIKYTSDFDTDLNETFYACADITYVATSQFNVQVPCFNATTDDFSLPEENDDDGDDDNSSTSTGSAAGASSTASGAVTASSGSSSGLSGGAIAGIVVGVVGGLLFLAGGFFFLWRRGQRNRRLRQQQANVRNVKWEEQAPGGPPSQSSSQDIGLRKL